MTRCPGTTIDIIEDKIHLVGPNTAPLHSCPWSSIWKTQHDNHGTNSDPPITSISDDSDIVIPNTDICSVIEKR